VAKLRSRIEYCLHQADCSSTAVEKNQWLLFASRWQRLAAEEEELVANDAKMLCFNGASALSFQQLEADGPPQTGAEATCAVPP